MSPQTSRRFGSIVCSIAVIAAGLVFSTEFQLQAEEIAVVNADFELGSPASPSVGPGGTTYLGNVPGWNVVNSGGVFEPDFESEASYPADVEAITDSFTAYSESNTGGLVSQLMIAELTLESDVIYILSVDIGHRFGDAFGGGFGLFRLTNPFPTGISAAAAVDPGEGSFTRQIHTLNGADIAGSDLGDNYRIGLFANPGCLVDFDNVVFEIVRLGDVDLNGQVDLLDVAPFVALISSGTFQEEGDINRDGTVNLLDVDPFILLLSGK